MKILLLGATGLAGQAFVHELKKRGIGLVGAARRRADLICDVAAIGALEQALEEVAPDAVINCVALVDVGACEADPGTAWQVNARPAGILANWSQRTGRPFLHVSTDHFYSGADSRAHGEDDPVSLLNEYARTKFAAEALALTAPNALILRTSIVGMRGWQKPSFAEWALQSVRDDAQMTLFEDAWTSSIDTGTFALEALTLFLDRDARGLLNLGASEVYSKAAFIREISLQIGCPLTRAQDGCVRDLLPGRASALGLDVTRAETLLDHHLPRLADVVSAVLTQNDG